MNVEARFENGAFLRGGFGATSRLLDNCNLLAAGVDAYSTGANSSNLLRGPRMQGTEIYPDGTTACHREYPLPAGRGGIGLLHAALGHRGDGHVPAQPRRADRRRGSQRSRPTGRSPTLVALTRPSADNWTGTAIKTVQLIREGLEYGEHNLHQLDVRASKRFRFDRYRFRVDFDLYNVFNSNWPYTVTSTFSTAANATWLRPTNALQSRFFKIGGQFDF